MAPLRGIAHFLHAQLLWLLITAYILAALVPGPGLGIRSIAFGSVGTGLSLNLPSLLLAVLLFNAGLCTRFAALRRIRESRVVLAAGALANLLVPVLAIFGASVLLHRWHNSDELQSLLTGMVLVAAMPIAGSSTAWTQNAGGDVTVSLGLVLLSTSLSPFTTPLLLHTGSWLITGHHSENLRALAGQSTGHFLLLFVLAPSLLGMFTRWLLGDREIEQVQPALKVANTVTLLVLCYMNAAVSLPQAVLRPDADFLLLVAMVTISLCAVAFGSGWLLARLLGLRRAQQAPLVFSLGMSNNGTGLVVATSALADHPLVLLPILLYNLVQHLVAGVVDRLLFHSEPETARESRNISMRRLVPVMVKGRSRQSD
jgi:BASS family bile acid:Na+ symporter